MCIDLSTCYFVFYCTLSSCYLSLSGYMLNSLWMGPSRQYFWFWLRELTHLHVFKVLLYMAMGNLPYPKLVLSICETASLLLGEMFGTGSGSDFSTESIKHINNTCTHTHTHTHIHTLHKWWHTYLQNTYSMWQHTHWHTPICDKDPSLVRMLVT